MQVLKLHFTDFKLVFASRDCNKLAHECAIIQNFVFGTIIWLLSHPRHPLTCRLLLPRHPRLFFTATSQGSLADQQPLNLGTSPLSLSTTIQKVDTMGIHPALPSITADQETATSRALSLPSSLSSSLLTIVDQENGRFERFASRLRAARLTRHPVHGLGTRLSCRQDQECLLRCPVQHLAIASTGPLPCRPVQHQGVSVVRSMCFWVESLPTVVVQCKTYRRFFILVFNPLVFCTQNSDRPSSLWSSFMHSICLMYSLFETLTWSSLIFAGWYKLSSPLHEEEYV
jgi:hypothetical protein